MKNKQLLFGGLIGLAVLAAALFPIDNKVQAFHTDAELGLLRQIRSLPIDSSIIFPTASACQGCHGYDSNHYAMLDFFGNDVNIYDDWRATMMANAAKDPFWRAKVSHEVLVNPAFQEEIETKCTSCHAPMGHYTAILRGHDHYTMADLLQDTIGLDGVSCSSCHKISELQIGDLHSGNINFDTNRVVYGPYPLPFSPPMADFVGLTPLFSDHINDAGLCASCHTLITDAIGTNGQLTGTTFVEQATYHEWLNSAYEQENTTCQSCHMPRLEESVVISANYLFLEGRSPYGLHTLAGANTFMLELMKEYREQLGIDALPEHFDETIAATYDMLQNQSLYTDFQWLGMDADTALFQLKLTNRAGHKFPSGYPARRLFIEFVLRTETGDTLFHSGRFNDQYELMDENPGVEPHYNVISRPDQVQIYEMAAGDDNGQFTVVLEHAYTMLKDNRLPPRGFSLADPAYDTSRIVGSALLDADFNFDNGMEGSGSDVLYFHIPTQGYAGPVEVTARAYYQSLPPKWLAPILAETTPQIDTFRHMFNSMDNAPVLVAEQTLADVEFPVVNRTINVVLRDVNLFPNPTADGRVQIILPQGVQLESALLYDGKGRQLKEWVGNAQSIVLPRAGVYFLKLKTNKGELVKKIVRVGQ
ncbi:MAG: T9SS type A sorting domain-containing protein [Phaeodactylibacter sp.]|nr:T9SS type A sorting domain-containing protein [Phaeodactylibacter sp.]